MYKHLKAFFCVNQDMSEALSRSQSRRAPFCRFKCILADLANLPARFPYIDYSNSLLFSVHEGLIDKLHIFKMLLQVL